MDRDRRIEELSERIASLEAAMSQIARPYAELAEQLAQMQAMVGRYFRLLDLYQRHGMISIEIVLPQVKDPMSREIIRILMDRPGMNISQVTEELRARTGSSSRRIVRSRLENLVKAGLLVESRGRREKTFRISEDVIKKWSDVLGLSK